MTLKLNILPSGFKDSALVEGWHTFQNVLIGNCDSSDSKDDPTFVKKEQNVFDIDFLSEVDFPFTLILVIVLD